LAHTLAPRCSSPFPYTTLFRSHDMSRDASELARRLAREAEAVCRHYLSNGRRQGRYWTVGDVRNTPGRSMFVRLSGPESGRGAADRKSTRLNSSHVSISYAVFC